MKALLAVSVLVGLLIAAAAFAVPVAASPTSVTPAVATVPTWPYTLYGSALGGWGLTNSSAAITSPGPVLTVTTGEVLFLKLVSAD